ncbi:MAG: GatB/YqeY domain-containing protein [Alphaproteobacteria bacterium]|nr:GatB/YqeY domain-containing protein [Alphaproteobacteria bacterium]
MPGLHEKLKAEINELMRAKKELALNTVRSVLSACMNYAVEKGIKPQEILSDEDVYTAIRREVKKRRDAIDMYTKAKKDEFAKKEQEELNILLAYLPTMMSIEKVKELAVKRKAELGINDPKEKGKLIGALSKELTGKAESADIVSAVNSLF